MIENAFILLRPYLNCTQTNDIEACGKGRGIRCDYYSLDSVRFGKYRSHMDYI